MNHFVQSGSISTKYVVLNKAILWKSREISMSQSDYKKIMEEPTVKHIEYKDIKARTSLVFEKEHFKSCAVLKREGQEIQWYCPIGIAEKRKD